MQPRDEIRAGDVGYICSGIKTSADVKVGDTIATGQTLVILEAMKMENNIDADRAGVVKQILVQQGATVMEGDVLIVIG